MSIRDHIWGVSCEQDAVWAEVCGMDPERADRALIMIWHVYSDESEKDGWFVLAGYLATVEKWAVFRAEWAKYAKRYGRVDNKGRYYIHMSEQGDKSEAEQYLPALRNIIAETVLCGFAIGIKPDEFRRAVSRIGAVKNGEYGTLGGSLLSSYYMLSYFIFMHEISDCALTDEQLSEIDMSNDRIIFFFDEGRKEEGEIYSGWEKFKENQLYNYVFSSPPRFEDDKEFVPLQAGDFLAYWFREGLDDVNFYNGEFVRNVYPFARDWAKPILHRLMVFDEDTLVACLLDMRLARDPEIKTFDLKGIVKSQRD